MKTSCPPCDVPCDHREGMMTVDFEWRVGPYNRLPCQLVHLRNRVHRGLRRFVPSTMTNIAYPAIATGHSKLKVETAQIFCLDVDVMAS